MNEIATKVNAPIDNRIKNAVLALLACLMVASTILAIRLVFLIGDVHEVLVAVSEDMKTVSNTAGNVARDVEHVRSQIRELREKIGGLLPGKKIAGALDEASQLKEGLTAESSSLPATSQKEIEALFAALAASGLKYEQGKNKKPISYIHARLYPKYLGLRKTLRSGEDFIDKVATKTMFGNTYMVVDSRGRSLKLRDWLTGKLKEIRAGRQ